MAFSLISFPYTNYLITVILWKMVHVILTNFVLRKSDRLAAISFEKNYPFEKILLFVLCNALCLDQTSILYLKIVS